MPFGSDIALTPGLKPIERFYIKLIGAPILGLRVRARTILPLLEEINTPSRVVDAGSGRGIITMACAKRFPKAEVIGVDLNDTQNQINKEVVRKIGISNLHFMTWDAMRLPELGRFDLILSTDMLEHLHDDLGGVRMFYDALQPGGHLLVHVPHLTRNTFGWKRKNWMDIEGHVRPGYTKDELTTLLSRGGFSVEKCLFNYNSLETLANDISKWITGAKEQNKTVYALTFPLLLLMVYLGSFFRSHGDGSGLVVLASREK